MKQLQQGKKKLQKGFTLIELMIVVAIIGVLSAIAIPAYQDYVKKGEAASAIATLNALKTPAELYAQQNGDLGTDEAAAFAEIGIDANSNNLGTLALASSSAISFTFVSSAVATGGVYTLSRSDTGWTCTVTAPAIKSGMCK